MSDPDAGVPDAKGVDKPPRAAAKTVRRAADRIRTFAGAHPDARAAVEYLGRGFARVVLVSESGDWGDVVLRSAEQAAQACELAGVTVTEWDRETSAQVELSAAYRIRMAGTGR